MERVLINQLDEHNEGGILAAKHFNVTRCIYLYTKEQDEILKQIKQYYINNLPKVKVEDILIKEGDLQEIKKCVNSNKTNDLLVNLAGGKRINSLLLSLVCNKNSVPSIYVDIKNKLLYELTPNFKEIEIDYDDLQLIDIVSSAGGEVISDASNLCDKDDLLYLTKQIYTHLELWHRHKQKLYDNNVFRHDYKDKERVDIFIDKLNNEEKNLVEISLEKLKELKTIKCTHDEGMVKVRFLNNYLKGFIFKSGTWLEIATHNLVHRIKGIDDIKSGVVFLWNSDKFSIRNEIDVIAIKDSITICISCKDSDKYDEVALNELNIYGSKIGGKNTIKILVSTKEPLKTVIRDRATAMGIHIVIFDGNEIKFVKEIESLIK